jgi:hypothetical protein
MNQANGERGNGETAAPSRAGGFSELQAINMSLLRSEAVLFTLALRLA